MRVDARIAEEERMSKSTSPQSDTNPVGTVTIDMTIAIIEPETLFSALDASDGF